MHPHLQVLAAGGLFGAAAGVLLIAPGKIAGISGILSSAVFERQRGWRVVFLLSLLAGGLIGGAVVPDAIAWEQPASLTKLSFAGLLIGLGARLGNGCTSGHGICGVGRLSLRSLVAVVTFSVVGGLTHLGLGQGWFQ